MAYKAYLLDIEGTTTPIDFVTRTLFPFARAVIRLASLGETGEMFDSSDLGLLWDEFLAESFEVDWRSPHDQEGAARYLLALMDRDRKSTALKSIQGKIWEDGYRSGELVGEIYDDVEPAFRRWTAQGSRVAIFSSGSVFAQKLLFSHLPSGDLTPLISAFFDTTTGPKRTSSSYEVIAASMEVAPAEFLFLSDVAEEVDAARKAEMAGLLVVRDGKHSKGEISNFLNL